MKRRFRYTLLLVVVAVAAVAPTASASSTGFGAFSTEEFAFLGCPFEVPPATFTCGVAVTTLGKANAVTVIDDFFPVSSTCFQDSHTTTFLYADGSRLSIAITGRLCSPSGPPNFTFTGTYAVVEGTGRLAGASGRGLAAAARRDGPIRAILAGSLTLPHGD